MPQDTPRGMDVYFEDFHGDLIPDELATSSDSGTITTNVGLTDNKGGRASILRLDNSNDTDNDFAEVDLGALNYTVQDGRISMEARVAPYDVSVMAVNVGFNDDTLEGGNTLPVELSGTSFTSNASTWIGFVYDADATNATWHAFWVDDDNDTSTAIATLNTGIALADSTWYTMRIELQDRGSGNAARGLFDIRDENGNHWNYEANTTIDRDVALVPHIGCELRSASNNGLIDIDYIEASRSREGS